MRFGVDFVYVFEYLRKRDLCDPSWARVRRGEEVSLQGC